MEKLIQEIMKDLECSREEAEEVAEMEVKAKGLKRYEQSDKPRAKTQKERKIDYEKQFLLNLVEKGLGATVNQVQRKTETELSFGYGGNSYTLKLIKHRPKK